MHHRLVAATTALVCVAGLSFSTLAGASGDTEPPTDSTIPDSTSADSAEPSDTDEDGSDPTDTYVEDSFALEPMTTTNEPLEPKAGEPTLTLTGSLVASYSEHSEDDGAVTTLSGTIRAEAGTVLVVRADACPAEATVFLSVANVESQESYPTLLCDPLRTVEMLMDEDDELIDSETYLWLPAAGAWELSVETEALEVSPITIDFFTDPTPTIVSQADLMANGSSITLSGIGDTVVYDLDGAPAATTDLISTGTDVACANEAWGSDPLGTPEAWPLDFCAHSATLGSGIPGDEIPVPVVVFARTPDDIAIELAPA